MEVISKYLRNSNLSTYYLHPPLWYTVPFYYSRGLASSLRAIAFERKATWEKKRENVRRKASRWQRIHKEWQLAYVRMHKSSQNVCTFHFVIKRLEIGRKKITTVSLSLSKAMIKTVRVLLFISVVSLVVRIFSFIIFHSSNCTITTCISLPKRKARNATGQMIVNDTAMKANMSPPNLC